MDFEKVIKLVSIEFRRRNIRYGLIGGFGMAALGIVRTTIDMDFLLHREDMNEARAALEDNGYKMMYESENVAQFVASDKTMGAIDILLAFRPISLDMLEKAKEIPVFEDTYRIPVLLPEDIIGLKVQAIANNPERRESDFADMVELAKEFHAEIDWTRLRRYFDMFDLSDLFNQLEGRME